MATGICFLDHMIDQLTSHAQLGVTVQIALDGADEFLKPHQDYADNDMENRPHDLDIFKASGAALGAALRGLVSSLSTAAAAAAEKKSCSATFCCPLDEAFAEAKLELSTEHNPAAPHTLRLAPYGTFSKAGRRWIGCYRCEYTTDFFAALAAELGAPLHLRKVRGDNAHHIVESTFKSFARVFRACVDGLVEGGAHGQVAAGEDRVAARRAKLEGGGAAAAAGMEGGGRTASKSRGTKETSISANVNLDAPAPPAPSGADATNGVGKGISSRVVLNDRVLTEVRNACGFYFDAECNGDVYIDDHHTAEDLSITIGQCLNVALGSKAGLARMGCAEGASGNCLVRAIIDLSNRPHFESDLNLDEEYVGGDKVGFATIKEHKMCGAALTCEMLFHVFDSLTIEGRATGHVEVLKDDGAEGHTLDLAIATARAYGAALAECCRVDPRRAGKVASSKGTLSI